MAVSNASTYVRLADDENEEAIEIPGEQDGTLLLSTVTAQFPGACGLKYRNSDAQTMRGVRLVEGVLHPPDGSWGTSLYIVVYPKDNKRKMDDSDVQGVRSKRPAQQSSDLIVMGLPWETSGSEMKQYFSQFGEVILAQLKLHPDTGKSKGYGFIKFANYEDQNKVLGRRHEIGGRWCDVKIPFSKQSQGQSETSNRIFVGRVTDGMKESDINSYFGKFGRVTDVFIPRPFRPFAFVTFEEEGVAASLHGQDHIINGVSVFVSGADPKSKEPKQSRGPYSTSGGGHYYADSSRQLMGGGHGWGGRNSEGGYYGEVRPHGNNSGPPPDSNYSVMGNMNMMNPAMLAAATIGSWNQMMSRMMNTGHMGAAPPAAPQEVQRAQKRGSSGGGEGYAGGWVGNQENVPGGGAGWQYNPYSN